MMNLMEKFALVGAGAGLSPKIVDENYNGACHEDFGLISLEINSQLQLYLY